MTLVMAVTGPRSIWLIADRRLSSGGRVLTDDARKVLLLETTDAVALLGYAGLGVTAAGTEPSDWMGRVLRGRTLSLEQSLSALSAAVQRELPKHLGALQPDQHPSHVVVVTALVRREARLYAVLLSRPVGALDYQVRWTRYVSSKSTKAGPVTPRLGITGSGTAVLGSDRVTARGIIRMVRAHDDGRISPKIVAAHLAALNYRVYKGLKRTDNSVGPRCVVVYRLRDGGGGHFFFGGPSPDRNPGLNRLPTMCVGLDINMLTETVVRNLVPKFRKSSELPAQLDGLEVDAGAINQELARLPTEPDETMQ